MRSGRGGWAAGLPHVLARPLVGRPIVQIGKIRKGRGGFLSYLARLCRRPQDPLRTPGEKQLAPKATRRRLRPRATPARALPNPTVLGVPQEQKRPGDAPHIFRFSPAVTFR